jgi:hypothetical protein
MSVRLPDDGVTTNPTCGVGVSGGTQVGVDSVDVTVTNRATGCSATAAKAFTYTLPCVAPTPTP